ncbi:hypothetical protein F5B21DRAFT_123814 [Xylaria acuta]|nr:hypothetical protein F5B21DRAFT_123814 [Xylaria acuta]
MFHYAMRTIFTSDTVLALELFTMALSWSFHLYHNVSATCLHSFITTPQAVYHLLNKQHSISFQSPACSRNSQTSTATCATKRSVLFFQ